MANSLGCKYCGEDALELSYRLLSYYEEFLVEHQDYESVECWNCNMAYVTNKPFKIRPKQLELDFLGDEFDDTPF